MKPVSLSEEAFQEAKEAAEWFEGHRPGLGAEFLEEMDAVLADLGTRPDSFPRIQRIQS